MEAPPGAQAAQIDIEAAYRNLMTARMHLVWMAVRVRAGIMFDLCHPFGLRSAAGNLGEALDATLDVISLIFNISFIAKWVDDIVPSRVPTGGSSEEGWTFNVTLPQILRVMRDFGWPINMTKLADFASLVVYVGFSWDLEAKTVALPERKRLKYLARLNDFVLACRQSGAGGGVSLHEAQKVCWFLFLTLALWLVARGIDVS